MDACMGVLIGQNYWVGSHNVFAARVHIQADCTMIMTWTQKNNCHEHVMIMPWSCPVCTMIICYWIIIPIHDHCMISSTCPFPINPPPFLLNFFFLSVSWPDNYPHTLLWTVSVEVNFFSPSVSYQNVHPRLLHWMCCMCSIWCKYSFIYPEVHTS